MHIGLVVLFVIARTSKKREDWLQKTIMYMGFLTRLFLEVLTYSRSCDYDPFRIDMTVDYLLYN